MPTGFPWRSLSVRLLIPIGAFAVLLSGLIAATFALQYADYVDRSLELTEQRLQSARASLLDRLDQAGDLARMLSLIPELADAVDVHDQGRIVDYLLPLVAHTDLDVVTVYRPDGVVLARGDEPALFGGEDELSPWVRGIRQRLEQEHHAATVHRWGNQAVLINCVALHTVNEPFGAVVVAGFKIDGDFLDGLRARSGVEVEAVLKGTAIAATLDSVRLSRPTLERRTVPLEDVIRAGAGFELRVLFDESADRSRFWARLTGVLLVLATLGLLVVGGSLWSTVTAVTRPLRAMTLALSRLAAGNTTVRIPYGDRDDEIGAMARAAEVFKRRVEETATMVAAEERLRLAKEKAEAEARVEADAGRRIRAIFFASPVPLLLCRGQPARAIMANEAALALFGTSGDELATVPIFDRIADPQDRAALLGAFAAQGSVAGVDMVWRTASGRAFWGLVSMREVPLDDEPAFLLGVGDITLRKTAEADLRTAKEAAELAYRELKRTQESLIQAEKMASLSLLVAGVAHEINTPVGIGLTSASFLAERTATIRAALAEGTMRRTELAAYLDAATEGSALLVSNMNRAHELIQSFKQVAVDQTSAERRSFELGAYVEEIVTSLSPRLRQAGHKVTIHVAEPVAIDSYPGALAQIVTNLAVNSVMHAWDQGTVGRIDITVGSEGSMAVLDYADDGRGIPAEHRHRVFEPFFTTRRGSGGTGLGLHIVFNLATQSLKGRIALDPDHGPGTRFTLRFPRVAPLETGS